MTTNSMISSSSIERPLAYIGAAVVIGSIGLGTGYLLKKTYDNAEQIKTLEKTNRVLANQIEHLQQDIQTLGSNQENLKSELTLHSTTVVRVQTEIKRIDSTIIKHQKTSTKTETSSQSKLTRTSAICATASPIEDVDDDSKVVPYNRPVNLYPPFPNQYPRIMPGTLTNTSNPSHEEPIGSIVRRGFTEGASRKVGEMTIGAIGGSQTTTQTALSVASWFAARFGI